MKLPLDGFAGLKENWKADALSGFMVFLLALPLSLGIAKASEFPPAMGVLTAMIGGLFVGLFAGSRLTIKGPAAGLITVCAGAVNEMGGGTEGWHLALGAVVVAGLIQIVFGKLRFGSLSDFFPHSAVHGMLAAIGLIIFSKQIHILLGIDPAHLKGKEPLELFAMIPESLIHEDFRVTFIGVISLLIIFGLPLLRFKLAKNLPAPLIVLLVTIPLAWFMDFRHTEPAFDMVNIGDFWGTVGLNVSFAAITTFVFWKYVIMFLFINSLESLLTVKAIDGLDPFRRQSDPDRDLMAVGAGNALAGVLGGLPMISEVARSSANVSFGGRTRWANVFHGAFLLVAMLLFIPVIEMIPNTALAAMLIAVGYRLASPNEFFKTYKIGSEQLVVFVITIIATISTDLLIGVGAGILTKIIFHMFNGVPFKNLFKAGYEMAPKGKEVVMKVNGSALFTNLLGFKKALKELKPDTRLVVDVTEAHLIDHSFMEFMHHTEETFAHAGGSVTAIGFDRFSPFSNHPMAARKNSNADRKRMEVRLTPRQQELRTMAEGAGMAFYPQRTRPVAKYTGFGLLKGLRVVSEANVLVSYSAGGRVEVADLEVTENTGHGTTMRTITVVQVSETPGLLPEMQLVPEGLTERLADAVLGHDIDFEKFPVLSAKYHVTSGHEEDVRRFMTLDMASFLEAHSARSMECHRGRLMVCNTEKELTLEEMKEAVHFVESFLEAAFQVNTGHARKQEV
jgi:MFS superfamily sulfate permease-like transporter